MTKLSKYLIGFICLLVLWAVYANHRENQLKATMAVNDAADRANIQALKEDAEKSDAEHDARVAALQTLKQKTVTVTEVIHALPQVITLPAPVHEITAKEAAAANAADPTATPVVAGDIDLPAADAKPLFDAQVDFKACLENLAKNQTRYDDLTKEDAIKDDQIKQRDIVIKGGTKSRRFKTAAKWAGIGALVGAGLVEYVEHK